MVLFPASGHRRDMIGDAGLGGLTITIDIERHNQLSCGNDRCVDSGKLPRCA
jgi:hypothetical protein